MSAAVYVAYVACAVMTAAMFATVGRMHTALRRDWGKLRITPPLIILGLWELSVGAVLITLGYWTGAIPVGGLGLICLAANIFMPRWEEPK